MVSEPPINIGVCDSPEDKRSCALEAVPTFSPGAFPRKIRKFHGMEVPDFLGGWADLIHPRHKGVGVWEDSRRHKGVGVWEDSRRHKGVGVWGDSRRHEGVGVWGDSRRHEGVGVWGDSRRHEGVGVWGDSRRYEGVGVWGDGRLGLRLRLGLRRESPRKAQ
jgi:hypothetical protein